MKCNHLDMELLIKLDYTSAGNIGYQSDKDHIRLLDAGWQTYFWSLNSLLCNLITATIIGLNSVSLFIVCTFHCEVGLECITKVE